MASESTTTSDIKVEITTSTPTEKTQTGLEKELFDLITTRWGDYKLPTTTITLTPDTLLATSITLIQHCEQYQNIRGLDRRAAVMTILNYSIDFYQTNDKISQDSAQIAKTFIKDILPGIIDSLIAIDKGAIQISQKQRESCGKLCAISCLLCWRRHRTKVLVPLETVFDIANLPPIVKSIIMPVVTTVESAIVTGIEMAAGVDTSVEKTTDAESKTQN